VIVTTSVRHHCNVQWCIINVLSKVAYIHSLCSGNDANRRATGSLHSESCKQCTYHKDFAKEVLNATSPAPSLLWLSILTLLLVLLLLLWSLLLSTILLLLLWLILSIVTALLGSASHRPSNWSAWRQCTWTCTFMHCTA
jgi:hypothetical protein